MLKHNTNFYLNCEEIMLGDILESPENETPVVVVYDEIQNDYCVEVKANRKWHSSLRKYLSDWKFIKKTGNILYRNN